MPPPLKLAIMIHVEDDTPWDDFGPTGQFAQDLAMLSTIIGPAPRPSTSQSRDAKISLQVGRDFLDSNDPGADDPYDLTTGSSLVYLYSCGGNFWVHGHEASFNGLQSTYACVRSAYFVESSGEDPDQHVIGKSGSDPSDGYYPFVAAAWSIGLKARNSTASRHYYHVPQCMRAYQMRIQDYQRIHHHDPAPGRWHTVLASVRGRNFFASAESVWHRHVSIESTQPHRDLMGSIVVIPGPCDMSLLRKQEGRDGVAGYALTDDDCRIALTEAWSFYQMFSGNADLVRAWYVALAPDLVSSSDTWTLVAHWVDSVNHVLQVHNPVEANRRAEWLNMTSIAWATSASYYNTT